MRIDIRGAVERAMKREEVILRAYAGKISWIQAAEILGISCRHLRRVRERYEEWGYDGLYDARVGKTSPKRLPVAVVEEVLRLYREEYFDFNVLHFHEKLRERHKVEVSYTWVKGLLQGAGLVARESPRKKHRRRRERKAVAGMMLHIDGSKHQWFSDERWHDLIVILDDATSEIYHAQLVPEESTRTVMAGLREVVETKGLFCALYSDRATHFFQTPKAGEPVDRQALTQVGRALRELGIQMIPAYSPQARGRSERNFRTWQGRLPQELRIRNIKTLEEANRFLKRSYIREFNRRFTVTAKQPGETAFVPTGRGDLDRVFSIQAERLVNRDNTVRFNTLVLQIDKQSWRGSLDGCRVMVYQHFDETISIGFGPQMLGKFTADGMPFKASTKAVDSSRTPKRKAALPSSSSQQRGHLMC